MALTDLTAEQESAVRTGHADGLSLRATAAHAGLEPYTVSRWSKRAGLLWPSRVSAAASQATRERLADARAALSTALIADATALRERLWEQHTIVVPTPTGPVEHILELPDPKAAADLATAVTRLVAGSENLDRMGAGRSAEHAVSMLTQLRASLDVAAAALEQQDQAEAEDEPDEDSLGAS